jgi:anaerobic carbon-monoxide dehydrogenase catalytic subunit
VSTTKPEQRSADPAARQMLERAEALGAKTVWDRRDEQAPQCGFGELGLCCHVCYMGPCRIDPFGEGPRLGICGADADLIVARNLARAVATGVAAHSDHGREVVEALHHAGERGLASGFVLSDEKKLERLAAELGLAPASGGARTPLDLARELARVYGTQFGEQEKGLLPLRRAPEAQRRRWAEAGITPRGIDREVVELLHRTHQGVESDPIALLRGALRTSLADGWGGSMIATDVSDVLFGSPRAIRSRVNLGVLEEKRVNILVHGHEPILSEMIVRVARGKEAEAYARSVGAEGLNVAGICCSANEILMRQGMPVAGNYLHQELALLTGAVDLMVVDVQCILPSLPSVAACHHTKIVTTSPKARIPSAERVEFDATRPEEAARAIVRMATDAFPRRDPSRVQIPRERMDVVAGFTWENIPSYLGGRFRTTYRPLNDAIASGRIRGVVGVVGCNTTRVTQDENHLALVRRLIAEDVLVVQTGCSAIASGKAGLLAPEAAAAHAGRGLREVCDAVGIPPVIHVGSCVDNSRILLACVEMVREGGIGTDISELPVAAAAPEAMSEKAIAIGFYAVASGIFTVFMPVPKVAGGARVRRYLEEEVERETGGRFRFTNDVGEAATAIIAHLDAKRAALKLPPRMYAGDTLIGDPASARVPLEYEPPRGVVALGCGKSQDRSQSRPPEE